MSEKKSRSLLSIYFDKLCTAGAMSSCAMGMSLSGERADSFMRLNEQMKKLDDELDARKAAKSGPGAKP